MMTKTLNRVRAAGCCAAILMAGACTDLTSPESIEPPPPPPAPDVMAGLMEVSISGIGSDAMTASARPIGRNGLNLPAGAQFGLQPAGNIAGAGFNGLDTRVVSGPGPVTEAATFDAWVLFNRTHSGPTQTIIHRPASFTVSLVTGSSPALVLATAGGTASMAWGDVQPGRWYHVALVVGPAQQTRFYVDGQLRQHASAPTSIPAGTDSIFLGRTRFDSVLDGALARVRIWHGERSAAQVAGSMTTWGSTPGLAWQLAEASGTFSSTGGAGPATAHNVEYRVPGPYLGEQADDRTLQLEPLSTGTFTDGVRGAGGVRYFWATFRVRNATASGAAVGPRRNLTLIAVATGGTLGGSAFSSVRRFDGSTAGPGVATQIVPTGLVHRDVSGRVIPTAPDVVQLYAEADLAELDLRHLTVQDVLPWGFVVRNAADGSRLLPFPTSPSQFHGVVTFAFKVPLQESAAHDPFTVTGVFSAFADTRTRVTESPQDTTTDALAALAARADEIGADQVNTLTARSYGARTRRLCGVRVAGTRVAPTAVMATCPDLGEVAVTGTVPGTLRPGTTFALTATPRAPGGQALPWVPVRWTSSDPDVATVTQTGHVSVRGFGSATITVAAGGVEASLPVSTTEIGMNEIGAGHFHACGIRDLELDDDPLGPAWCWGAGGSNRMGDLSALTRYWPREAQPGPFTSLAVGGQHTCGITNLGDLHCWGNNDFGQLTGTGTWSFISSAGYVQVSAGFEHTCGLKADGTVECWGRNEHGELGRGTAGGASSVAAPVAGGHQFTMVSAGYQYTLGVTTAGALMAWGSGAGYQLGTGTLDDQPTPLHVGEPHLFARASAGMQRSAAVRRDSVLYIMGGAFQQPTLIGTSGNRIIDVSAGWESVHALTSSGRIMVYGSSVHGPLGTGVSGSAGGQQVALPADVTVTKVSVGRGFGLATTADGEVWAWGRNDGAQLGIGLPTTAVLTPVRVR